MNFDFSGKVVVVVGGTSGINRGIAEHFAAAGAKVAVASRSQEKVDDTVASLKEKGAAAAMGFVCDVRNLSEVEAGLAQVHQAWGDFDSLVSGAAGNFPALASKMSANAFRTVVDIDLMGTYHVMRSAYPFMKRPGSSIINISAPQAYLPYEAQSHVCAAKAGVDMLTRTTAMEWGSEGIRVNSVVPGAIDGTEGMKRLAPTEPIRQMILDDTPMQRFGTPADVANLCLFLNSELATFISGQIIAVDGALYQRGSGTFNRKLAEPLYKM
ncbi:MAG TPA: SDR family oxidoreductase [Pseudomonadales bacterium]|nr:SDR family oxidoreductase [Pseudomonadales bacterium]